MSKALIAPPDGAPLTLAALKSHLRIETGDEDIYLEELVDAAAAHVEAETGKSLITRIWRIYLDRWPPDGVVDLPVSPVQAVEAVTVYGADGEPVSLPTEAWLLDRAGEPARVYLVDRTPPGRPLNGIEIDVIAGYGGAPEDIPDQLVRAMLETAAYWYEFRAEPAARPAPPGLARLLAPFRRMRL